MTFEAADVVVVPFPFTDRATSKRRPAVVLSDARAFHAGQSVLAMITSRGHAPWPLDLPIGDRDAAGLPAPSVIRMKLFTLDNRLVVRKVGALAQSDRAALAGNLQNLFAELRSPAS